MRGPALALHTLTPLHLAHGIKVLNLDLLAGNGNQLINAPAVGASQIVVPVLRVVGGKRKFAVRAHYLSPLESIFTPNGSCMVPPFPPKSLSPVRAKT